MPKSLADGHRKLTICTTKPNNPLAPTVTELNAGIDVSLQVLASDFSYGATDSNTVSEQALGEEIAANVYTTSNWQFGLTFWRYFDATTKLAASAEETGYQAAKVKGTTLYCYLRENGKKASEAWVATEEAIFEEVITDHPQLPSDAGGFIKRRVGGAVQTGGFVTVAAGA